MERGSPSTARRSSVPRWGRRVLFSLVVVVGLFVVPLLLLVWHFNTTPTFAEHLRTRLVEPGLFAAPPGAGTVLNDQGSWAVGTVDPFAVGDRSSKAEAESGYVCEKVCFTVDILHGDDVLLHTTQEIAIADDRSTHRRVGAAARTVQLQTGAGLRAVARIYLHDVDKILQEGEGRATFDVLLGAGSAANQASVVDAGNSALPPIDSAGPWQMAGGWLAKLVPWRDGAPQGILHRVRGSCALCWRSLEGGRQGAGVGPVQHSVNTHEYSYRVAMQIEAWNEGARSSHKVEAANVTSWNGVVW